MVQAPYWLYEHVASWGQWLTLRGCRSSMPFPHVYALCISPMGLFLS